MTLTPEQKKTVTEWVAAGEGLSAIQTKLRDHFQVSLTYRDVRFLVDDLNLDLKDAAPKVDTTDVTKAPPPPAAKPAAAPEKKGFFDKAKEKLGLAKDEPAVEEPGMDEGELPPEDLEDAMPAGASGVSVSVDKVTLIPGAVASGTVTFSDGVTGKWMVDQYGRPGFSKISQPGYRPTPEDGQAFMRELSAALQQRGF